MGTFLTVVILTVLSTAWPAGDRFLPHWALVAGLWIGKRGEHRSGFEWPILFGVVSGVFTAEPWAIAPLQCCCGAALTGIKMTLLGYGRTAEWLAAMLALLLTDGVFFVARQFVGRSTFAPGYWGDQMIRWGATAVVIPFLFGLWDLLSRRAGR